MFSEPEYRARDPFPHLRRAVWVLGLVIVWVLGRAVVYRLFVGE